LASAKPPRVLITSIRGLIQPIIANILDAQLPILEINKTVPMTALIETLSFLGYSRTDLVERRGDFAVRGGIIDLFPPDLEHPVRVDYFGDEIEELAYFTVADQRTFEPVVGALTIFPCRELLLTTQVRERARYLSAEFPSLTEICNKIAEGISVDGMESLIGALNTELKSLIDFFPENFQIILVDEPRITSRAMDLIATNKEFLDASWSNAAMGGKAPIDIFGGIESGGYFTLEHLKKVAVDAGFPWRSLNPYASHIEDQALEFEALPIYRNDLDAVEADLKKWLAEGYFVIFQCSWSGHCGAIQ
jgi:transcription-repair coupling factor (superfamily II helicase)